MNSIVEREYAYFVAEPLVPGSPVVRTAAEPTVVLARLVAILRGMHADEPVPNIAQQQLDGASYTLSPSAVLALQGADGDPEMEWEDVIEQWATHPDGKRALAGYSHEELLKVVGEFRALAGDLPPGHRIYCRQMS